MKRIEKKRSLEENEMSFYNNASSSSTQKKRSRKTNSEKKTIKKSKQSDSFESENMALFQQFDESNLQFGDQPFNDYNVCLDAQKINPIPIPLLEQQQLNNDYLFNPFYSPSKNGFESSPNVLKTPKNRHDNLSDFYLLSPDKMLNELEFSPSLFSTDSPLLSNKLPSPSPLFNSKTYSRISESPTKSYITKSQNNIPPTQWKEYQDTPPTSFPTPVDITLKPINSVDINIKPINETNFSGIRGLITHGDRGLFKQINTAINNDTKTVISTIDTNEKGGILYSSKNMYITGNEDKENLDNLILNTVIAK